MKTLLLMRHAKSSRSDPALADHQRPLTPKGEKDAEQIGRLLAKKKRIPDLILASTAVRAAETAIRVARLCLGPMPELKDQLYQDTVESYLDQLTQQDADAGCILLIGHNPVLEQLIETLIGSPVTLATAQVAVIKTKARYWGEITKKTAKLQAVWQPKKNKSAIKNPHEPLPSKPLCELVKNGFLKKHPAAYAQEVKTPRYVCADCGRTAAHKKHLCRPVKL